MADEIDRKRVRKMLSYWLWFCQMEAFTRRQKLELLRHFSDLEEIYLCKDFSHIPGLTQEQNEQLLNKDMREAEKLQNVCRRKDIRILSIQDKAYPSRLRNIADPPVVLFYKGVLPDFTQIPSIGIVGTRKATAYGLTVARQFGAQISQCGGLVVSGGAAGVDTMALQGALDAQGETVAVLGCGVDVVYPRTNRRLFMQIQERGCLMSEYLPGEQPKPWHFPERNRIISGLSNGVLVVEAPEKSGALITARDALEQGRDVYTVPANINMPTCAGSNALLSNGAAAVFTGWDVMKEYADQYPDRVRQHRKEKTTAIKVAQPVLLPNIDKKDIDIPADNSYSVTVDNDALTPEESKVVACLSPAPRHMDEVIAQLDMPAGEIMTVLTKLSLKGMVTIHPGRLVSVRK